jgi:hypothetical protein
MAKHYTQKHRSFEITFLPSQQASAHGGQLAVHALLTEFGLAQRVRLFTALDPRTHKGKGYDPAVYVTQVLFCFTSGGCSLADAERLNEDEALKALLGIEKFPDQSALGEWLRAVGEPGWQALRELTRQFVRWALLRAEPGRYRHTGRLECFFDDSQIEVQGHCFEGAAINYEGNLALSWQTLWVGPFWADSVLGATSASKESPRSEQPGKDVSAMLPGLLEANEALWCGQRNDLYADSASSAGKYLEAIAARFEGWSVSYNKWTGPLEAQAAAFPENYWSGAETLRWRDGSQHAAAYAWLRYQPGGCKRPQLFAVVRHKAAGELLWRYAFVACPEQEGNPKAVFEHHRLKGDKERGLSELLSDLDLHHPPCQSLAANRVFYALATLAFNVLVALKLMHLPVEQQGKRVRTLIRHLLLMPVELKRHARRLRVCLYVPAGWVAWWRGFLGQWLPRCRQLGAVASG